MNVFVLCTGRCGSTTFARACSHISNFTSGHETRSTLLAADLIKYPKNHIEVDNRLSWLLGLLDEEYGNNAFYVHLTRDQLETAKSFNKRWDSKKGIIKAYSHVILLRKDKGLELCIDYCDTVNKNIKHFLKDKTNKMRFSMENAKNDFRNFWKRINAEGNLDAALSEWGKKYNRTEPSKDKIHRICGGVIRLMNK